MKVFNTAYDVIIFKTYLRACNELSVIIAMLPINAEVELSQDYEARPSQAWEDS